MNKVNTIKEIITLIENLEVIIVNGLKFYDIQELSKIFGNKTIQYCQQNCESFSHIKCKDFDTFKIKCTKPFIDLVSVHEIKNLINCIDDGILKKAINAKLNNNENALHVLLLNLENKNLKHIEFSISSIDSQIDSLMSEINKLRTDRTELENEHTNTKTNIKVHTDSMLQDEGVFGYSKLVRTAVTEKLSDNVDKIGNIDSLIDASNEKIKQTLISSGDVIKWDHELFIKPSSKYNDVLCFIDSQLYILNSYDLDEHPELAEYLTGVSVELYNERIDIAYNNTKTMQQYDSIVEYAKACNNSDEYDIESLVIACIDFNVTPNKLIKMIKTEPDFDISAKKLGKMKAIMNDMYKTLKSK